MTFRSVFSIYMLDSGFDRYERKVIKLDFQF